MKHAIIFGLVLLMLPIVNAVLTDNIVGYYNLDNANISAPTIYDLTPNHFDGYWEGATSGVEGKIKQGFSFDGDNDRINLSDASLYFSSINKERSYSFWLNVSVFQEGDYVLRAANTEGFMFINLASANAIRFRMWNNAASYTTIKATGLRLNTWEHIVAIFNRTTLVLFVNGTKVNQSATFTPGVDSNTRYVYMGASETLTNDFAGRIDEIGVWNRSLTSSEVSKLYRSGIGLSYPFSTNFTIQANNNYTSQGINTFSAVIEGRQRCYQEQANTSTVCEGLSTGTYYYNASGAGGGSLPIGNWADGSFSTFTAATELQRDGYITYTKPSRASTKSLWQVKDTTGKVNLTIPSSCWDANANIIEFKFSHIDVVAIPGFSTAAWYCKNVTQWQELRENNGTHAGGVDLIYEESMWWDNGKGLFTTTTGTILTNISDNRSLNITVFSNNYFNKTFLDYNSSSNLIANLTPHTEIYALDLISNKALTNFSINWSGSTSGSTTTSNGTAFVPIFNGVFEVTIYDITNGTYDFQTKSVNLTGTPYLKNYTFEVYTSNSINITIKSELNNSIIRNKKITLDFIGDSGINITNKSTTTGKLYIDLLSPDSYIINYNGPGYEQRSYILTLLQDLHYSITLYLLNDTVDQLTTFTVKDEDGNILKDVVIKANRLFVAEGVYRVVAMCRTAFNGKCSMWLDYGEMYSFTLVSGDNTESITPYQVIDTDYSFNFIVTGTFDLMDQYLGIAANITYNTVTENFRFEYDTGGGEYTFCMYMFNMSDMTATTYYDFNCTTGSTGTLLYHQPIKNETIKAAVQVTINPTNWLTSFIQTDIDDLGFKLGTLGLFIAFMLLLLLALIGAQINAAVPPFLVGTGLLMITLFGLIDTGGNRVVPYGVVALCFIAGILLAAKSKFME